MADGLADLLDDLKQAGDGDKASVGEVVDAFENRSMGAILTIFAALAALPVIGAIPGASLLTGSLIVMAAGQSFLAESGLWVPQRLREGDIERDKLENGIDKAMPWAERIDSVLRKRMTFLVHGTLIAVCAILLALTFYPLAFVPWGVQVPSFAILAFGLALIGNDGLFAAIGYAFSAATLVMLWMTAL